MKGIIRRISAYVVLQSILSFLLGLFLIFWPETTTMVFTYLLAGYLAIIGLLGLINYFRHRGATYYVESDLIGGIFELLIALVIFIFPQAVASVFSLILGIFAVLNGVLNMVRAMEIKKYGEGKWILVFILNVLVTLGGIIIIVNPFASAVTFVLLLGILLIGKSITDIISYVLLLNSIRKADIKTRE